jgi:hypothetical protein
MKIKEKLEKDQSWLSAFREGVQVKRHAYIVLAYSIRVDQVDIKKQIEGHPRLSTNRTQASKLR